MMGTGEDELLDRVAVEQVLARLSPADRCMMELIYEIVLPDDWGNRPLTYTTIGEYVGERFEGQALSEAAIRYRRDVVVRVLRGERGDLRRPRRGRKKK